MCYNRLSSVFVNRYNAHLPGEFSNVYEIKSFRLQTDTRDMSIEQVESRQYMKKSKKYHNTSRSRYAVKHLKQNYIKDHGNEAYAQAAGSVLHYDILMRIMLLFII